MSWQGYCDPRQQQKVGKLAAALSQKCFRASGIADATVSASTIAGSLGSIAVRPVGVRGSWLPDQRLSVRTLRS